MDSFCFLETGITNTPHIVAADGSIVSIVRVDGVKKMIGPDDLPDVVNDMTLKLSSYFGSTGHAMQVWFARDPDASKSLVSRLNRPARNVARNLTLELDDLFDEREQHLTKFITWEGCYIALWTRPAILTKTELENIKKENRRPPLWPQAIDTQSIFQASQQLATRHEAFVSSIVSDFHEINLRCEALEAHEGLAAIRGSIYPDLHSSDWRPVLPGDVIFPRNPSWNSKDVSHLFAPRLQDQLFPKGSEVLSPRIVRVCRYNFASMDMTIGPQEIRPFSELLNRMIMNGEFPWRVSFLIEGNGLSGAMSIKNTLASVVGFTNSENLQIKDAIRSLQQMKQEGEIIARYRVSFSTWAPSDQIRALEERASQLQRAVESWGYCSVSSSAGDPLAANFSSVLGLDIASTAPAGAPPLREALYMMPWNRDASPWEKGSVLFRTPDGRPWPYEPGSSLQSTFIDLIFALSSIPLNKKTLPVILQVICKGDLLIRK